MQKLPVLITTAGLACALAACGGSGSSSSSATPRAPAAGTTITPTTAPPAAGGDTVSTGPVRATLLAADHSPRVNQDWAYSVRVTDAAGHPLSGTVDIEFAFNGQVVGHDTPPTKRLTNGRWHDTLKFPASALGFPLSFQAVVKTSRGSVTLDWPVIVRR